MAYVHMWRYNSAQPTDNAWTATEASCRSEPFCRIPCPPPLAPATYALLQLWKWDNREWFESRKCTPPAPPLHPAVQRVIEQWFHLVDDDGSGTLDHRELMEALRVGQESGCAVVVGYGWTSVF